MFNPPLSESISDKFFSHESYDNKLSPDQEQGEIFGQFQFFQVGHLPSYD